MTREEAIKEIRGWDFLNEKETEAIQTLIPELHESEDERARKGLIEALKASKTVGELKFILPEPTREECIAYLEKQKEQKPDIEAKLKEEYKRGWDNALLQLPEEVDSQIWQIANNSAKTWEQGFAILMAAKKAFDKGKAEGLKEQKPVMIQWTGKNLKEVIDFTGKSPRFDEWFKSWEEFEDYVHSHDDILKLFCEDGSHYEVPVGAWIVKTPDGYNIPSRFRFIQKPAEWSEEDEKMRENLLYLMLENNSQDSWEGTYEWLKSIHPSWKPSEDEMAALREAMARLCGSGIDAIKYAELCDLEIELKKLM